MKSKNFNGITVIIATLVIIVIGIIRHPTYWALIPIAISDLIREYGLFGHYVREMFR